MAWGRGKVLAISEGNAQCYFPSRPVASGDPQALVRLGFLRRSDVQTDSSFDTLTVASKKRASGTAKAKVKKVPANLLDQAIAWFQTEYPLSFLDPKLLKDEIKAKRDAHTLFMTRAGNGAGRTLLEQQSDFVAVSEIIDALYHATNIPHKFEIMAIHDGVKDHQAAARLLQALLDFMDGPTKDTFTRLANAIEALPAAKGKSRVLTWPNVTILPFLAAPDRFMVVKPESMKKIAARMGTDVLLSTQVTWDTYSRAQSLASALLDKLRPLGARDYIDVQSFIWVTRGLS